MNHFITAHVVQNVFTNQRRTKYLFIDHEVKNCPKKKENSPRKSRNWETCCEIRAPKFIQLKMEKLLFVCPSTWHLIGNDWYIRIRLTFIGTMKLNCNPKQWYWKKVWNFWPMWQEIWSQVLDKCFSGDSEIKGNENLNPLDKKSLKLVTIVEGKLMMKES